MFFHDVIGVDKITIEWNNYTMKLMVVRITTCVTYFHYFEILLMLFFTLEKYHKSISNPRGKYRFLVSVTCEVFMMFILFHYKSEQ